MQLILILFARKDDINLVEFEVFRFRNENNSDLRIFNTQLGNQICLSPAKVIRFNQNFFDFADDIEICFNEVCNED